MNIKFFIARRYLFSPKTTHIINVISFITGISFAIVTFALVVIISIFNGLESLIINRFNSFDSDLKVVPLKSKTFVIDKDIILKLTSIGDIDRYAFVFEENALVKYHDIYHPFRIKGVDLSYADMSGLDTMMVSGRFALMYQNRPVAVVGMGVSAYLSISLDFVAPLKIYAPNRYAEIQLTADRAFNMLPIYPVGIYSIDQEIDNYIIVPIDFARQLFKYESNEATALEIKLKDLSRYEKVETLVQQIFGQDFDVKNRFEQHQFIYQIMQSEKIVVFLILIFILIIASFNITSSLTMLILEKKEDIFTLQSIGFSLNDVKQVFLLEGWFISLIGTIAGVILGLIFCILQKMFGIIPMDATNPDAFIVKAYPVEIRPVDIFIIIAVVLLIGYLTSKFPVRYITRRYLPDEHKGV